MPTGQLLVWQARIPMHPMACMAELERAIASAPKASAFAKSAGILNPPVMINVTSLSDPGYRDVAGLVPGREWWVRRYCLERAGERLRFRRHVHQG